MGAKLLVSLAVLFICLIYVMVNPHERHYHAEDGQLCRALHICLPGYATVYYPEQTVELSHWGGTKYDKLVALVDGAENPEITASMALKVLGLYTDYNLQQKKDGHWILHRPAKTERYFTMSAFYRIWWGSPATL